LRFLIDQNLPVGLLPVLAAMDHHAEHVKLIGLAEAADEALWNLAISRGLVIVSKDSDFLRLARLDTKGALLRLAIGNCSNTALYEVVKREWAAAVLRLGAGERIVEIRR
jgi:predicted nuclease of predicted toxin-antitoxin system